MKVKLLVDIELRGVICLAGTVVDISDPAADSLISGKRAEVAVEAAPISRFSRQKNKPSKK